MRLFVILDENDYIKETQFGPNDVLITNTTPPSKCECRIVKVSTMDLWADEQPTLFTKSLFQLLPKELAPLQNSFYITVSVPLFSVIKVIDYYLSSYSVDELVLSGGGNYAFLTTQRGEGEGIKWRYRTSWMVNPILYNLYHDNCNIIWRKNRGTGIKFFIREVILSLRFIIKSAQCVAYSLFTSVNTLSKKIVADADCIVPITLHLQLLKLSEILSHLDFKRIIYLAPYSTKVSKEECVTCYFPYKLFGFFKYQFFYHKLIANCPKVFCVETRFGTIQLSKSEIINSIRLQAIDYFSKYDNLSSFLDHNKKRKIVSCSTFGSDTILSRELGRRFGNEYLNFQVVSMSKMNYPDVDLADRYYLYSDTALKYYQSKSACYYKYIPPYQEQVRPISENNISVGIFFQPDDFADRYIELCKCLDQSLPDNYRIVIKPHYRQNKMDEICKMVSSSHRMSLLDSFLHISKALSSVDVAISISSSIFFDSLLDGTMAISYLPDRSERDLVMGSNLVISEVNFVCNSYPGLLDSLYSIRELHKDYIQRRKKWLISNSCYTLQHINT